VPVVGVLKGDPRSDEGQQFIKLGVGQAEIQLKAAVIQAELLEQMVKLAELGSPLKGLVNPNTATTTAMPLLCSTELIQSYNSLNECSIHISHLANKPPSTGPSHKKRISSWTILLWTREWIPNVQASN
jgi:hypothetical protein